MRRGRITRGAVALAAAALVAAPGALAATPQKIYNDFADNGRLDGNYTNAELRAALKDAAVQGYGNPTVTVTMKPTIKQAVSAPKEKAKESSGVLGARSPVVTPKQQKEAAPTRVAQPLTSTKVSGKLPFTGAELGIFALVGSLLLGSGILLRATARQKSA